MRVHFNVAGVTFGTRRAVLATLQRGQPVKLRPEPNNLFDPNAIRVETLEGDLAGYVPASLTPAVSRSNMDFEVLEVDAGFPYLKLVSVPGPAFPLEQ